MRALKPYHLNIIRCYLTTDNAQGEIDLISQQIGRLPEVLIEEINVIALEYLGDILIEDNSLLTEYLPFIKSRLS